VLSFECLTQVAQLPRPKSRTQANQRLSGMSDATAVCNINTYTYQHSAGLFYLKLACIFPDIILKYVKKKEEYIYIYIYK
jgi:hypothetical protein